MSWSFKKVGTNREAVKAAVQVDTSTPQAVKDEVCARVDAEFRGKWFSADGETANAGSAVLAESYGHLEADPARPWKGMDTILIRVQTVALA